MANYVFTPIQQRKVLFYIKAHDAEMMHKTVGGDAVLKLPDSVCGSVVVKNRVTVNTRGGAKEQRLAMDGESWY